MRRIRILAALAIGVALTTGPGAAPAAPDPGGFADATAFSGLATPLGASAACPAGASMQVVGHPDDDLLFQSPDILHDVQSGKCVRTVAVTAGERGDSDIMLSREAGLRAAYANMAGVTNTWTTADAGVSGHPMPLYTLSGKPTVSLIFVRLPEGFWGGGTSGDETIRNLWQGSVSQIHTDDGTSTYTKSSLTATLTALMTNFQPDTIRTQDYIGTFGDGDHDDHHAASYFARQAHLTYPSSHTFTGYQDYETQNEPQNVFGADLTGKTSAFNAYLQFDSAPCGSPPNCGNNEYSFWLKRQYVKGTESGSDITPPSVSAVTPAGGAGNVSLGTSVSATFSEAIAPASVTNTSFVLRDEGGNAVSASVSASGSTATLQPGSNLQPSTTYTATLLSGANGIKDVAGNALASDFTWSFTTTTPDTTPPTVSTVTPASGAGNVSLGMSVSATFSEPISASSVTGTSFVLRDGNGSAVSASVSASGSTATLQPSSNLQPSTTYTATLVSGSGGIKDTSGNALASDHTWSFTTADPDTTPPTVLTVTPANDATNVNNATSVSATFSEAISASSVTGTSFVLRDGNGSAVNASVSGSGQTATLQPSSALQPSTTYTARLASGATGIKDTSGNALASDYNWSFTTAAGPTCPCSIWTPTATPQTLSIIDDNSYELGVRFQSEQPGYITGVRFYKGIGNTGIHVGHVWSNDGTQLAAATFTNETDTGWQQVTFSTPVAISANTPYVASYFDPAGHFALDRPYFTTAHSNPPLQALADGTAAGPNGVFSLSSGFPGSTFQSSNYWVDVVFATSLADTTPPTVSSATPADGATGVDPATNVSATFSEPIAPESVTSSSFVLRDGNGNAVNASVSANGSTATLQPSVNLQPGTTYTATLLSGSGGIKDQAGNALASNFSWSFTTLTPDTTPPTVVSVTPANGAANVSLGTSVSATFSEGIQAASVTGTTFVLRNANGNAVTASVSASGATATLQPSTSLQPGTTYTGTLVGGSGGIKDSAGNALGSDFTWSFTTVVPDTTPPTVSARTPAAGAVNVSLGTSVSATFSEPIAPASVTTASFVLRDAGGNTVSASVSASGSTATLQPTSALQPSTTYTATLLSGSNGIKDLAGNALAADVTWSFTTLTPDLTPPNSTVGFPASSSMYNATGWTAGCVPAGICGTASDPGGVQRVEVSIRRVSTNRWWTGSGYSSTTERWFVASGTTSWNYPLASSTFPGAGSYVVHIRATDNSGNVGSPPTTTFVYDNTNPSSAFTFPANQGSYTTTTWNAGCASRICGTASDATAGVRSVQVSIRRGSGNYWNGSSFSSASEVFLTASGTTSWALAFPGSNFPASGNYRVRVRAIDNAGNTEGPSQRQFNFTP
jgi:LmbE family N-acetylglucosaminyl deacetylase